MYENHHPAMQKIFSSLAAVLPNDEIQDEYEKVSSLIYFKTLYKRKGIQTAAVLVNQNIEHLSFLQLKLGANEKNYRAVSDKFIEITCTLLLMEIYGGILKSCENDVSYKAQLKLKNAYIQTSYILNRLKPFYRTDETQKVVTRIFDKISTVELIMPKPPNNYASQISNNDIEKEKKDLEYTSIPETASQVIEGEKSSSINLWNIGGSLLVLSGLGLLLGVISSGNISSGNLGYGIAFIIIGGILIYKGTKRK